MAKEKKQHETGMDRLKNMPLWQWGLIVIFAGLFANLAMGLVPASGGSAARRGQEIGRAVASLFFILVGVVLIVMHFVRGKK